MWSGPGRLVPVSNRGSSATSPSTRPWVRTLLAATAVLALTGSPAAATEAPATPAPGATPTNLGPEEPGTQVCRVTDERVDHVTGMVATAAGIHVVEGGPNYDPEQVEIFTIDPATCAVSREQYGFEPRDPQDLAVGQNGALWVADIGDRDANRDWLTFERVDLATGATAVPYRADKPATGNINGTAMLLQADDTPIIIANTGGQAVLYRPNGPMTAGSTQNRPTLVEVGRFTPIDTGTANGVGAVGRLMVTGAAIASDRSRVVLRTLSDAYEFTLGADGDIVAAITTTEPVLTPLPNEENGQAITYSVDNSRFLTLSFGESPVLRSYTPWVKPLPAPTNKQTEGSGGLDFGDITMIAAAAGVVGLGSVVAGIIGIVRFRRTRRDDEFDDDDYDSRRPPRPRRGPEGGRPPRPGRPPVPVGQGDDFGRGEYGSAGRGPRSRGYDQGGYPEDGYGEPGYGDQGQGYGYADAGQGYGGGQQYGAAPHGGGAPRGQVYGSGASGGQVYGSGAPGGQVYGGGQGGQYGGGPYGGQQPGGQQYGPGGQSGGTYGRSRRPDDEPPRRGGYGRDNIDV